MSLDNIGEISFGHHFNSQDTKDNPIAEAFKTLCNGVIDLKARLILTYFPFMWYMPFGPAQRLTDYTKMFNDVIDEVRIELCILTVSTPKFVDRTVL